MLNRENRYLHFQKCKKFLVACNFCKIANPQEYADAHTKQCPDVTVECVECLQKIARRSMLLHLEKSCIEASTKCEKCSLPVKRKLKEHHAKNCGAEDITCQTCLAEYKRSDAAQHNCFKDIRAMIEGLQNENRNLKSENIKLKNDAALHAD